MSAFHPDLVWHARLVPRLAFGPRTVSIIIGSPGRCDPFARMIANRGESTVSEHGGR
jgi:hypothetical protein